MHILDEIFVAKNWSRAHQYLDVKTDWKEFFRLRKLYNSENRFYHTWDHIYHCLWFTSVFKKVEDISLVHMAIFYHDIQYDVMSKTNEQDSAEIWMSYANSKKIDQKISQKIYDMIIMTATHKNDSDDHLMKIMNDADMSIFMCHDENYIKYAKNVWKEYKSVGKDAYLSGRLAFLRNLDPTSIFQTDFAKSKIKHVKANIDLERTILEVEPEKILE